MSGENTTSIQNLPNSSSKEDDLVNKILSELEDNEEEEIMEPPEKKPMKPLKKIIVEEFRENREPNREPKERFESRESKESKESKETKETTFLSRIFPNIQVAYHYLHLSLLAFVSFVVVIFMTPKFIPVLSRFQFLFDTSQISQISQTTVQLSKIGVLVQAFINSFIFFVVSFFIMKK